MSPKMSRSDLISLCTWSYGIIDVIHVNIIYVENVMSTIEYKNVFDIYD